MKQEVISKKVFIRTLGCQMNERDSEIICGMMMQEGYTPVSSVEEADLIIYNTCSVRKHAEDRVWGNMEQLKRLKKWGQSHPKLLPGSLGQSPFFPIIGLVGCMGKAYGREIFKKLPHVDFVCGPANIYDIPDIVEKVKDGKRHILAINNEKRPVKKWGPRTIRFAQVRGRQSASLYDYRAESIRAFVNISEGCNNFCSYCIVPYVRGREVSRPIEDIIDEIRGLVDKGIKEVTLLGQNVNSYGEDSKKGTPYHSAEMLDRASGLHCTGAKRLVQCTGQAVTPFCKLLEKINKIEYLKRIRFMTSHPKNASIGLFKAMANLDKVCEHLHLPLQSGSDTILKAMNRGYTVSHYLDLIDMLRKEMPDAAVSTDIIVGFPGETEKDFMDTYLVMKKIAFDSAFIFKYSPRPYTKAASMEDDVLKKDKEERNQVLLNLQDGIMKEKSRSLIGKIEESMGISKAKRKPDSSSDFSAFYIKGRTRANQQIIYKGSKDLIGDISNVKINGVEEHALIGELV